jgi:hypothetical protein
MKAELSIGLTAAHHAEERKWILSRDRSLSDALQTVTVFGNDYLLVSTDHRG